MRVLIACEFSGIVREAFARRGHDAWSCDLLPSELPGKHYQKDICEIIINTWGFWDLMIAHPPCTYLTVSGNRWFKPEFAFRFPHRKQQREKAIDFFRLLMEAPIPKVAVENPIGIMSTIFRKPDQIIHPYQFGDPERKSTCLWLRGLPKLIPTKIVEPNLRRYKSRKGAFNQWYMSTMFLPPLERMKARSRTFPGIAEAMAEQWGTWNRDSVLEEEKIMPSQKPFPLKPARLLAENLEKAQEVVEE